MTNTRSRLRAGIAGAGLLIALATGLAARATSAIEGKRGEVAIVVHIQGAYVQANRAFKMAKVAEVHKDLGEALILLNRAKLAQERADVKQPAR